MTGVATFFVHEERKRGGISGFNECFRFSLEYRANIEGDQALPIKISVRKPELDLEEDEEGVEEGDPDEQLSAEL